MSARILIIEDNRTNLELMHYLLDAFGHTVISAANGGKGLEAIRLERPDLIICDVQLPGLDGFEVARYLKSHPEFRSIPLVAVTALAMVGDRDRVLAAGFDGYLAKPIDPETFVKEMEVFLSAGQHSVRPLLPSRPAAHTRPETFLGFSILVVDDLPLNLDLARSILEPSGYEVITAESLSEGLAAAGKHPCDLILSDVRTSEGSGYQLLQAAQARPRLRMIPFILITSTMLDESDRAKGLALGATRFLCRPIEPEILLAEIKSCLEHKGMR